MNTARKLRESSNLGFETGSEPESDHICKPDPDLRPYSKDRIHIPAFSVIN